MSSNTVSQTALVRHVEWDRFARAAYGLQTTTDGYPAMDCIYDMRRIFNNAITANIPAQPMPDQLQWLVAQQYYETECKLWLTACNGRDQGLFQLDPHGTDFAGLGHCDLEGFNKCVHTSLMGLGLTTHAAEYLNWVNDQSGRSTHPDGGHYCVVVSIRRIPSAIVGPEATVVPVVTVVPEVTVVCTAMAPASTEVTGGGKATREAPNRIIRNIPY
jgi:hypothetical protein